MQTRCDWCGKNPHYVHYHDKEWAVPVTDSVRLFEMLSLEAMQAGLSWLTVLHKRQEFRKAFQAFDPAKVSEYGEREINDLLRNSGIIRHRGKISAVIDNARCYLALSAEMPPAEFFWGFATPKTAQNRWRSVSQVPSQTEQSRAMSKALKSRGFKFVGPTICYAFMQSIGVVNDHLAHCFRYLECQRIGQDLRLGTEQ